MLEINPGVRTKLGPKVYIIDDGRRDFYLGLPEASHIKITQEFIDEFGFDYDKLCEDTKEVAAMFMAIALNITAHLVEEARQEKDKQ